MGFFVKHGDSVILVTASKKKAEAKAKELKELFPSENITIKKV